jgi:hypothetical protein
MLAGKIRQRKEALMHRGVLTIICAALVMAGVWWWAREPLPEAVPVQGQQSRVTAAAPEPTRTPARQPNASVREPAAPDQPAPPAETVDYQARMRAADDYWDFAQSLHAKAQQGDAAAQFYLASALSYCESLYDWYFIVHQANGAVRHRTLDEAQQLTATRPVFTPDDVSDIQKHCQRLRGAERPPFGSSREWMDAAIAANYPRAQASAALGKALQGRSRDSEVSRAARDEARHLAFDSLRTRDPNVMAQLGDVAANLAGDDAAEARKQQWVWPLAACQREPDCKSMSEWKRLFCNIDTQCQPFETPVDVIRRQAGNDFDEIERRARELNEKIDAGTLEESDIGRGGG